MLPFPPARALAAALLTLALGGCAAWLPDADRLNVQQGNVLSSADIDRLVRGQSRARVRELIGEPVLASPFRADRWDYVYYKTEAGSYTQDGAQRLTLFFGPNGLERIVDRYDAPADPLPEAVEGPLPERRQPAAPAGGSGPGPAPGPDPGESPTPAPG